jgi:hypothetical protein
LDPVLSVKKFKVVLPFRFRFDMRHVKIFRRKFLIIIDRYNLYNRHQKLSQIDILFQLVRLVIQRGVDVC